MMPTSHGALSKPALMTGDPAAGIVVDPLPQSSQLLLAGKAGVVASHQQVAVPVGPVLEFHGLLEAGDGLFERAELERGPAGERVRGSVGRHARDGGAREPKHVREQKRHCNHGVAPHKEKHCPRRVGQSSVDKRQTNDDDDGALA